MVGVHLRRKDQKNRESRYAFCYASTLKSKVEARLYLCRHADRKASSTPEAFVPTCVKCTLACKLYCLDIDSHTPFTPLRYQSLYFYASESAACACACHAIASIPSDTADSTVYVCSNLVCVGESQKLIIIGNKQESHNYAC